MDTIATFTLVKPAAVLFEPEDDAQPVVMAVIAIPTANRRRVVWETGP